MEEKIKLGECRLFVGDKPVAIGKIIQPANFCDGLGNIPDRKREKKLSFSKSVSFDVQMTKELMKLRDELNNEFEIKYSEWLKRVDVAVRKILTEYIDNPFKTNPFDAKREEFEKRRINALVYQEMANGSQAFVGVQQGTTLICVDGTRIENFGKQ